MNQLKNYIPTPSSIENPKWSGRNLEISKLIKSNSTILDLGCGAKDLLKYLNSPKKYLGIDHYSNNFADLHLNFNEKFILPDDQWDYIVCSGLIEYITDVDYFFESISKKSQIYIITFWKNVNGSVGIANNNLPKNFVEFEQKLKKFWNIENKLKWKEHNIYVCS